MSKEDLKRRLDQLRAELAEAPELDADTRITLEALASDIERTLDDSPDAAPHSMRQRFEEARLRFAEYPRFSRILTEVTDALTKLGL